MSFGVCLFLQGVIRKYGRKADMSGLHKDFNVPHNFLSSRRLQKAQERTNGKVIGPEGRVPALPPRVPALVQSPIRTRLADYAPLT